MGYVNVDELLAQTSLEEAARRCGIQLDVRVTGREIRLDCPFGCPGDHAGKREISVNVENREKVFLCHAYSCQQFRGNLATLMHGWLTGQRPSGDKLRGAEFNQVKNLLAGNMQPAQSSGAVRNAEETGMPTKAASEPANVPVWNIPLSQSQTEQMRALATLDEKFVVDVSAMHPVAAAYVRRHWCLSPESMRKFRVGVLPMDGGGDKRGFSLRGHIVYSLLSEEGDVLAWIGRDPEFERKQQEFDALRPEMRGDREAPHKHKVPKGLHRSIELFGQHASRLREPGYRETIARCGILISEGFNDVIGLDNIAVPAVGLGSNKISEAQVDKVTGWARRLSDGKVTLMFDCQETGDSGAKEALWMFAQRGLDVRLGWALGMHGGAFDGREPESLTRAEWDDVIRPTIER